LQRTTRVQAIPTLPSCPSTVHPHAALGGDPPWPDLASGFAPGAPRTVAAAMQHAAGHTPRGPRAPQCPTQAEAVAPSAPPPERALRGLAGGLRAGCPHVWIVRDVRRARTRTHDTARTPGSTPGMPKRHLQRGRLGASGLGETGRDDPSTVSRTSGILADSLEAPPTQGCGVSQPTLFRRTAGSGCWWRCRRWSWICCLVCSFVCRA